jgi:peptidoglycan hydrolase FlgJ
MMEGMSMNAIAALGAAPIAPISAAPKTDALSKDNPELKKAFTDFVGQTFYGQMLKSLRSTVDKPAYFHGGRGEEMFQEQMDRVLSEKLAETSAENFSGPMFDLFCLQSR